MIVQAMLSININTVANFITLYVMLQNLLCLDVEFMWLRRNHWQAYGIIPFSLLRKSIGVLQKILGYLMYGLRSSPTPFMKPSTLAPGG